MKWEGQELTCMCCRARYQRGKFRCCAPPNGMASHEWLSLTCPMAPNGCGRCALHCQCPNKAERFKEGPLVGIARKFLAEHPHIAQQLKGAAHAPTDRDREG
jgi:hypothetical protein